MCQACRVRRGDPTPICACGCGLGDRQVLYGNPRHPTARRSHWENVSLTCTRCGHSMSPRKLELPPELASQVKRKRRIALGTATLGAAMLGGALWELRYQPTDPLVWFLVLLLAGLCLTFAGIDGALFGYQSMQDWQEGF